MSIGKETLAYKETSKCPKELIEGLVVCIDPSIGSSSSSPGYAVYREGQIVTSGIFPIDSSKSTPDRLRSLANHMRKLYSKFPADVLVYEEIPAQRHGFGNANAHASLLKALGAILSVPQPSYYVGIYPVSWKAQARSSYVKGDEADAREIGHVVIELAHQILAERKKERKRVSSK